MKNYFKHAIGIVAAIAMAGFTGCNKDDGPASGEERGAVLNITLENPSLTRVAGEAPGTATSVTDYSVFVLDGDDNVAWKAYVEVGNDPTKLTTAIEVTTAATAVYVIANAGSDLSGSYTTKAALESASPLVNLSSQYTSRWATGAQDGSAWTFQTPDSNGNGLLEEHVTLSLKFIAARIVVTVNNKMDGYDGTSDNTVKIMDVAVLNARGQSRLFPGSGTTLIPSSNTPGTSKFMEGLENDSFDYYPNATDYTVEAANVDQLNSPYTFSGENSPTKSHFYVFENNAMTVGEFPTIVTLVGTAVDGTPVYFPVHLAPYETWASNTTNYAGGILRGNSYNITITLDGDARIGSGGGTDDPTVNVTNVELMATIEITDWTPVPLGKNF